MIARLLADAAKETEHQKFSARFLLMEWEAIVDAWLIETWEAYRDVLSRTQDEASAKTAGHVVVDF